MSLFHPNCKECEAENQWLKHIIELQAQIILNLSKPKPHSVSLIYNFSNNKNQTTMADLMLLFPGPNETGTPSLIDNTNGKPITPVTYSNVSAVVADPSVATVTVDPVTAIATAIPLKAGTTTVTITATVAFTDSNGNPATDTETVLMNITVTAAADGVTLSYTWA